MKNNSQVPGNALVGLFVLMASVAAAHTGPMHSHTTGFADGFLHPVTGLDHLVAMIAVGLWAARTGGRMLWLLPMCFVLLMAGGSLLGMAGIPFPMVEAGIAASLLVLGLVLATAIKVPNALSLVLVGAFALFHGHAHGAEMHAGATAAAFIAGFALCTAALHGAGIGAGLGMAKWAGKPERKELVFRASGAAVTALGVVLLAAG